MNKAYSPLFLLIIISMFLMSSVRASDVPTIDFGSFTASSALTKTAAIYIPVSGAETEHLELWLEQNMRARVGKNQLCDSHIVVETRSRSYRIGTEPQVIDVKGQTVNGVDYAVVPLLLSYTVNPEDPPGLYEGILAMREQTTGNLSAENRINLRVQVEPWVRIESPQDFLIIGQFDFTGDRLITEIPGRVRISANAPWTLYVQSQDNDLITYSWLLLRLISRSDSSFTALMPEEFPLNAREIALAAGEYTLDENDGYCEVPFTLAIRDYTQIRAGQLNFPVIFRAEPKE